MRLVPGYRWQNRWMRLLARMVRRILLPVISWLGIFIDPETEIAVAMKMKGVQTVLPMVHGPCGMAAANSLNIIQVMSLLVEAKERLRRFVGATIPFTHVHHRDGRRRTYFFRERKASVILTPHSHSFEPQPDNEEELTTASS
jgi:hypothetical protein